MSVEVPAKAGIQNQHKRLDSRLILLDAFAHGNDKKKDEYRFYGQTHQKRDSREIFPLFNRKDPGFRVYPDAPCQLLSFVIQAMRNVRPEGDAIPGFKMVGLILQLQFHLSF